MKDYFPSYRGFCLFLYRTQLEKRLMSTFEKVVKYIFALFFITLFWIGIGILIFFAKASKSSSSSSRDKYPSAQYRQVVKKGLLWDSVEYHER